MSITSLKSKLGIIFYGPYVHENRRHIYKFLEVAEATCYCWDSNLEKEYPNFYDLQRLHWEQGAEQEKTGLKNYARKLNLPDKKECKNGYNVYSNITISHLDAEYAAMDTLILKMGF